MVKIVKINVLLMERIIDERSLDKKNDAKLIRDVMTKHRRWDILHEVIFSYLGQFYKIQYQVGATENQDEGYFDGKIDDKGMVNCIPVKAIEKTIIDYEDI